jgi:hypothetical protein
MSRGAGPATGAGTGLAGGLLLAGAGASSWVSRESVREVAGVEVQEREVEPGTEFAPAALPLGLAVVFVAGLALIARGAPRRVLAWSLALLGVVAVVVVALGVAAAAVVPGRLGSAPWVGLAGAVLALVGGVLTSRARGAGAQLDERYTVEGAVGEPADDDEWALAADESPEPDGRPDGGQKGGG